jgi:PncC family amidohydrolase
MQIAIEVGRLLRERGWTLGTAESCTGGLIGHWITNVSGSSEYYLGGVVAYANEVKQRLLGVPAEMLAQHGAVSSQVAEAMAEGVRGVLGTNVGLAVTGVAGPLGGTPEKPVGTVFVGLASPRGVQARLFRWSADRLGNKELSAQAALRMLAEALSGEGI